VNDRIALPLNSPRLHSRWEIQAECRQVIFLPGQGPNPRHQTDERTHTQRQICESCRCGVTPKHTSISYVASPQRRDQ
jgi:hypothetical protein